MRRLLSVSVVVLVLAVTVIAAEKEANEVPDAARAILDKAETIELVSILPHEERDPNKETFRKYPVLGKTPIKDGEVRKRVVGALVKGAADNKEGQAKCFDPRHAIRATHDGKTVELVICFACNYAQVYVEGKAVRGFSPSKMPEAVLDKVLTDAKVPLAPKEEK